MPVKETGSGREYQRLRSLTQSPATQWLDPLSSSMEASSLLPLVVKMGYDWVTRLLQAEVKVPGLQSSSAVWG